MSSLENSVLDNPANNTGEGEEILFVAPQENPPEADAEPAEDVQAMNDLPLEGIRNRRKDDTSSAASSSDSSSWLPVPEAICVYHQRGSCLRLNCRYFHGSAQQLAELRSSGASHYRFDASNHVETPKAGEELPSTTAYDEPSVGIRYEDPQKGKRKKPIVCLAFLSGTCRRPDCRFTHLPSNVRPLPATACAYFAVGTCKRGTCRYFHGSEEELTKLKNQGATMYNPQTNEPYDKIPDFDEPKKSGSRSGSETGSNRSRSNLASGRRSGAGGSQHSKDNIRPSPKPDIVMPQQQQLQQQQQPQQQQKQVVYTTYSPQPGMVPGQSPYPGQPYPGQPYPGQPYPMQGQPYPPGMMPPGMQYPPGTTTTVVYTNGPPQGMPPQGYPGGQQVVYSSGPPPHGQPGMMPGQYMPPPGAPPGSHQVVYVNGPPPQQGPYPPQGFVPQHGGPYPMHQ